MTKDKALKMAIDNFGSVLSFIPKEYYCIMENTLNACKEALKQDDWKGFSSSWEHQVPIEALEQPAQEPVAMFGGTSLYEYLKNSAPIDTPMDEWTQGYEECKRRIFNACGEQLKSYTHPVQTEASEQELVIEDKEALAEDYIESLHLSQLDYEYFRPIFIEGMTFAEDIFKNPALYGQQIYTHPHQWQGDKDEEL